MPNGRPRYVRIYDSDKASPEHRTIDRYTVIFTGQRGKGQIITMSADPFHPQGVFCHTETSDRRPPDLNEWGFAPQIGRALWGERDIQTGQRLKLGVRIGFWDLPTDCQRAVVAEYCDLWDLERPKWMQSDAGVPKHERPIDINKVKDGRAVMDVPDLAGPEAAAARREVVVAEHVDGGLQPTPAYDELYEWPKASRAAHIALGLALAQAITDVIGERKGAEADRAVELADVSKTVMAHQAVVEVLASQAQLQAGYTYDWPMLGSDTGHELMELHGSLWPGHPYLALRDKVLNELAANELILDSGPPDDLEQLMAQHPEGPCGDLTCPKCISDDPDEYTEHELAQQTQSEDV